MDNQEVKQVSKWDYDVKKFKSIDEVLDFAIGREIDAQSFYMKLSSIVKDDKLVRSLIDLAAEELEHETKLQAVRLGKAEIGTVEIGNLDIVDYAKDVVPTPQMNYIDLLVIGMKKEETSRKLYTDLAAIVEQETLKNLFRKLAMEEADHKLRFELEYDLMTF